MWKNTTNFALERKLMDKNQKLTEDQYKELNVKEINPEFFLKIGEEIRNIKNLPKVGKIF